MSGKQKEYYSFKKFRCSSRPFRKHLHHTSGPRSILYLGILTPSVRTFYSRQQLIAGAREPSQEARATKQQTVGGGRLFFKIVEGTSLWPPPLCLWVGTPLIILCRIIRSWTSGPLWSVAITFMTSRACLPDKPSFLVRAAFDSLSSSSSSNSGPSWPVARVKK
jgi:hypothetical protein